MDESINEILKIAEKAVNENDSKECKNLIISKRVEDSPIEEKKAVSLSLRVLNSQENLSDIPCKKCLRFSKKIDYKFDCINFINEAFDSHNECRRRHGFDPLTQNTEIGFIAQQYANQMARTGRIAHSDNKFMDQDLGENVYSFDFRDPSMTGKKITNDWYNEIYGYKFMGPQYGTGHFTQLIWKSSKEVGFGIALSNNGRAYFVANYFPCGNLIGKFSQNVNQPLY